MRSSTLDFDLSQRGQPQGPVGLRRLASRATWHRRALLLAFVLCAGLALGQVAASMPASARPTGIAALLIGVALFGSEWLGRGYRHALPSRRKPLPVTVLPWERAGTTAVAVTSSGATSFQLAYRATGRCIRTYQSEGAALGFVRDVARIRGRLDATQFELRAVHPGGSSTLVARGDLLVRRALQDQVL